MKLRNRYITACLWLFVANIYAPQSIASGPEKCAMNEAKDQITSFTVKGCDWGKLSYRSNAPSIVDIDTNTGIIRAQGLGVANITATLIAKGCTGNGQEHTCEVMVVDDSPLPAMNSITKTFGDPPFILEYSADIDNNFIYESSNKAVATISGKRVTIKGVGQSTITAIKKGTLLLNGGAKSVTSTLTVNPAHQEITYTGVTDCTYGQECIAKATIVPRGVVHFESATPDVCAVTPAGVITAKKNQSVTCHIKLRSNRNNNCVDVHKKQAITINESALTLADLPPDVYKSRYSVTMTTTGGYGPYTYQVTSGSLPAGLQLIKTGDAWQLAGTLEAIPGRTGLANFTITATDKNQVSASKKYAFYTQKAELVISNVGEYENHSPSVSYGRSRPVKKMPDVWLNGVADQRLLSMFEYQSEHPEICSVENKNGALTIKGNSTGKSEIIASLKEEYKKYYSCSPNYCLLAGKTWEPKNVVYTCHVTPAEQTITFASTAATTCTYGTSACYVTATSDARLAVHYSLAGDPAGLCAVDSATGAITIKKNEAGYCIIKASQAGNTNYKAAADNIHRVAVIASTLALSDLGDGVYRTPYNQTLTTTGGYAPYTYALASGSRLPEGLVLTKNGQLSGTLTGKPGDVTFTIKVADANGATVTRLYTLKIAKAPSYIKFPEISGSWEYGKAGELTAFPVDATRKVMQSYPSGLSHKDIHYHSDAENICQVKNDGSKGWVKATGVGKTKITATLKGNDYYEDGVASYICEAARAHQAITQNTKVTACTYGQKCQITATAPGGKVKFTSKTADICTVSALGKVTQIKVGTCIISVNQSGNTHYLAAPEVKQSIEMMAVTPSLSNLENLTVTYSKNRTIELKPTSSSQGKFSYESSHPEVVTVNEHGLITILDGTGGMPITITVTQAAHGNYAEVKRIFTVTVNPGDSEIEQIYGDGLIVLTNQI